MKPNIFIFLNVGRTRNDGKYKLYDITDKLRDSAHRLNGVGRPVGDALETESLNESIFEKTENVNRENEEISNKVQKSKKAVAKDSEGNTLSEGPQEYFKDSKVRDEDGNLLVMYHGTDSDFTVFDKTKGRANMDIKG